MSELRVGSGESSIVVSASGLTGKALEAVVDTDLSAFAQYFASLGNDGLDKFERAAIKTYLHWKIVGPRK